MAKIYKFTGFVVVVGCCIFFFYQIANYSDNLKTIFVDSASIKTLLVLILLYLFIFLNSSLIWYILMKSFTDFGGSLVVCIHIYMFSQFAKYLPGNVGHHVGRVYLSRKYHFNTLQVIGVMVVENILPVAASVIFSIYIIEQYQLNINHYFQIHMDYQIILFSLIVTGIMMFGLFLKRKKISTLFCTYIDPKIRLGNVFLGFLLVFLNFFSLGLILLVLIKSYSNEVPADFLLITGIFAVSWVLGFITPGSPGGIGVREALLVAFLSPIYGNIMAVWLSIMLRIITTIGDGVAFLIGLTLMPIVSRLNKQVILDKSFITERIDLAKK